MRTRSVSKAAAVAAAFVMGATAATAGGTYSSLSLPTVSMIKIAADGRPLVVDGDGTHYRIQLRNGAFEIEPAERYPEDVLPDDALPDGRIADAGNGVRAWLSAPTARYGHAVLGDGIEAGALSVSHPGTPIQTITLPTSSVFEDRYPRFADMDGDGMAEILVVRAYADAGGALTLVDPGSVGRAPRIVAEGPAIGTPNRWLNPVGVGDVDGDGRPEALVVITPHIGGTLTAYEWRGDRLVVDHEMFGFSNHAIGARELALSAVADLDGDGAAEVIVPNVDRTQMTVVSFAGPEPRVIRRIAAPDRVAHRVVIYDMDGDNRPEITFATDAAIIVVWQPGI